jgi:hypothetical protein
MAKDWTDGKKTNYNYQSLAQLSGNEPGFAVFRRFRTLNAKNILYLQAELAELEEQLAQLEADDQNSGEVNNRKFQWDARLLMEASPGADQQWKMILQIRTKLDEYNRLLLQHQRLHSLPRPNCHDLGKLREWLEWPVYGACFLEVPQDAWDERFDQDLVALSSRPNELDRFSIWLTDCVVPFVHNKILHRTRKANEAENQTYQYSDRALSRISEVVAIITSSSLPVVPIFALHFISSIVVRLCFTLAFSLVFTCCMAIFTSAKRSEIFAATVTLASVQVVFIGTSGNNG